MVLLAANLHGLFPGVVINKHSIELLIFPWTVINILVNQWHFEDGVIITPFVEIGPNWESEGTRTRCPWNIVSEGWHWHDVSCTVHVWRDSIVSKEKVHPVFHGLMLATGTDNTSSQSTCLKTLRTSIWIKHSMQKPERSDVVVVSINVNSSEMVQKVWLQEINCKEFDLN